MNIRLEYMTKALCRDYHRGFVFDPAMFPDGIVSKAYVYSDAHADAHWLRQRDVGRIHLAVMLDDRIIGDVVLKNIDRQKASCTMGIHLQNDSCKNKGYGTEAELQVLEYAFNEAGMEVVYADALIGNKRSQHVLEKVGFQETYRDNTFVYYICQKSSWKRPEGGFGNR